jgi:hypothetical protein
VIDEGVGGSSILSSGLSTSASFSPTLSNRTAGLSGNLAAIAWFAPSQRNTQFGRNAECVGVEIDGIILA